MGRIIREFCVRLRYAPRAAVDRLSCQRGQSTTEYTLVILVAATISLLLLNWAKGGAIVAFFDTIFRKVTEMF